MPKPTKVVAGQIWVQKLSPRSTATPRRIEIVTVHWTGSAFYRNVATQRPSCISLDGLRSKYALEKKP